MMPAPSFHNQEALCKSVSGAYQHPFASRSGDSEHYGNFLAEEALTMQPEYVLAHLLQFG
jgi:hypothetical protein